MPPQIAVPKVVFRFHECRSDKTSGRNFINDRVFSLNYSSMGPRTVTIKQLDNHFTSFVCPPHSAAGVPAKGHWSQGTPCCLR
uniref:Phb4 n=1 Tax=Arundo donax TaxID=35708 RepID=A0A0A9DNC5_ARUDO